MKREKAHTSGTMAGVVARTMTGGIDTGSNDEKGALIVRCPPVSTFERAHATLVRAGLISGSKENQIAMALADFSGHFIATHGDELFNDVLHAFIAVGCHEGYLSEEREAFEPHPSHLAAMQELSSLGYASEVSGGYRWCDLVGSTMLKAGYWNEEFQSRRSVQIRDTNRAAKKALETMPDKVRRTFFDEGAPTTRAEIFRLTLTLDELAKTGEWPWIDDDFVWLEDNEVAQALIAMMEK